MKRSKRGERLLWRVWRVEPASVPDQEDIRVVSGALHVSELDGFTFVSDVFVPPVLVRDAHEAEEVALVAVKSFNHRKNEFA